MALREVVKRVQAIMTEVDVVGVPAAEGTEAGGACEVSGMC